MNERIQELWEQCKTSDWHQDNPTYDHEKFAELIIKECIAVGNKAMSYGNWPAHMISRHFGVEE